MATRFLLVDDHALYREGLRALLATEHDYVICAEASDAREGLLSARENCPDVAIVDIQLPGANGLALASDLMRLERRCRVIILTMHDGDHHLQHAIDIGVAGYIRKNQSSKDILEAIAVVARGGTYWPSGGTTILARGPGRLAGALSSRDPIALLSRREREVFDLLVRGWTNEGVGQELDISVKTVETHRARINRKLNVKSPSALMRFAALNGLVSEA